MKVKVHNRRFLFDAPIKCDWKYLVKRVLLILLDNAYKFVLFLKRPKPSSAKKFNLVACAIFRDEAPFIKEWIEHNSIVGIEHYYMYNNFSVDNYQEILEPYIKKGVVTLIDWPVEQGQFAAYNHFMANFRTKTQWVTFIDLDEFYCPFELLDLKEWLVKYRNYPSVIAYWRMFTTSGKIDHNFDQLVIEQYTMSVEKTLNIGKGFLNTDWDFMPITDMHLYHARVNVLGRNVIIPSINEFKKNIKWGIHRTKLRADFTLELNHYFSKSYNELVYRKIKRGDAVFANRKQNERINVLKYYEHQKQVVSYDIFRFLVDLKLKMSPSNDL